MIWHSFRVENWVTLDQSPVKKGDQLWSIPFAPWWGLVKIYRRCSCFLALIQFTVTASRFLLSTQGRLWGSVGGGVCRIDKRMTTPTAWRKRSRKWMMLVLLQGNGQNMHRLFLAICYFQQKPDLKSWDLRDFIINKQAWSVIVVFLFECTQRQNTNTHQSFKWFLSETFLFPHFYVYFFQSSLTWKFVLTRGEYPGFLTW